ncbi:MAG: nucleotidyltransferase domain-containing protein, partial [Acidobacteriaceae bacterium]|nr:nucleotidyltransferase domain-containing protein [Acidobacteriaceae bacterium]
KAQENTVQRRRELEELFCQQNSPDTSVVVFGSVARQEVTCSSDLDWILLLDGPAAPEHKEQEREVERVLASRHFAEPGKSGVFGKMVGSHDLIHNIGGEDDRNSNTTRRVLLLLESLPIGNREAYDRVRRQVVRRYLRDDRGILYGGKNVRIPRFLLNDFTRYWRTITVDFVYKQRTDDKKWALRNAKLRMSRKLIFAAGLMNCFFCHLDSAAAEAISLAKSDSKDVSLLTAYLENQLALPPLEVMAKACVQLSIAHSTAQSLFDSYNRFLVIMDDPEKRSELQRTHTHEDLRHSKVWKEMGGISRQFHGSLVTLFMKGNESLCELTMEYGLF